MAADCAAGFENIPDALCGNPVSVYFEEPSTGKAGTVSAALTVVPGSPLDAKFGWNNRFSCVLPNGIVVPRCIYEEADIAWAFESEEEWTQRKFMPADGIGLWNNPSVYNATQYIDGQEFGAFALHDRVLEQLAAAIAADGGVSYPKTPDLSVQRPGLAPDDPRNLWNWLRQNLRGATDDVHNEDLDINAAVIPRGGVPWGTVDDSQAIADQRAFESASEGWCQEIYANEDGCCIEGLDDAGLAWFLVDPMHASDEGQRNKQRIEGLVHRFLASGNAPPTAALSVAPDGQPSEGSSYLRAVEQRRDDAAGPAEGAFRVVGQATSYRRFLQVEDWRVAYPDGRQIDFDIVGHPRNQYHFVVVFTFATSSQTVTMLEEFAQAALPHRSMVWGLPCGGYDPRKHSSALHAAQSELSEEAHLTGGTWHNLLPSDHPGVLEAKWCRNRFTPFLCVDPIPDSSPGQQDAEEHLSAKQVSIDQIRQLLVGGEMLLPSVQTCLCALGLLEKQKLI